MALLDTIKHHEAAKQHRPWPRAVVGTEGWEQAIEHLTAGRCTLLGLWGDAPNVHAALLSEDFSDIAVISYTCEDGTYPSVGAKHPPAIRLERALRHQVLDVVFIVSCHPFQSANGDRLFVNAAPAAGGFAWTVASAAKYSGKHIGIPVDHVRLCISALRDQPNILGYRRVCRAGCSRT